MCSFLTVKLSLTSPLFPFWFFRLAASDTQLLGTILLLWGPLRLLSRAADVLEGWVRIQPSFPCAPPPTLPLTHIGEYDHP